MTLARVAACVDGSIVDGPGYRFTVFFQGCQRRCPGCHNPGTHEAQEGYVMRVDDIVSAIRANPIITGVTFSGGEPFEQVDALLELCRELSPTYDLWAYSGYTIDELRAMDDARISEILDDHLSALVDGPYIHAQRSLALPWRGSANQRIIMLKEGPNESES